MDHNYFAEYENVRIRPLRQEDIEKLRIWRNNMEQVKFLRNIGYITPKMQQKWFEQYLTDSNHIIFAIEETKDLRRIIGSMALYDFHDCQAEIGKIQIGDADAHGRGFGRKSLVMGFKIGFDCLNLRKIVASVHQENIAARSNDIKIGFRIVGQHKSCVGGLEDELEIVREEARQVNTYFDSIRVYTKEI